jgi:hypothetical protein
MGFKYTTFASFHIFTCSPLFTIVSSHWTLLIISEIETTSSVMWAYNFYLKALLILEYVHGDV